MNSNSSLTKKSIVYGIGNLGTLAINFFLVPLYTFYLSEEDLGLFDILASSLVVASPVFFVNIELSVLRWILANKNLLLIKRVLSNAVFIIVVGLVLFSLLFFAFGRLFNVDLFFLIYTYFISNFIYIVFKQVIRSVYSSWHYVLTELVYVLVILVCFLFFGQEYQLKAIFLSYAIASTSLIIYLIFLGFFKKLEFKSIDISFCKELLRYSYPLSLNAISLWLNNQSNKYIIAAYLMLGANGIYAVAFKFAYVIQILNRIFYMSFQDKMFFLYEEGNPEDYFSATLKKYTGVLFSFLYLLVGLKDLIIPHIIDKDFIPALKYMPILGLGVVFFSLGSVLGIIYQCEKRNIDAFKTSLLSGLVILVLSYFIVPKLGLIGASMVFALGNFIFFLYRFLDIKKYVKIKIDFISLILFLVLFLVLWATTLLNLKGKYYVAASLATLSSLIINIKIVNRYLTSGLKFLKRMV